MTLEQQSLSEAQCDAHLCLSKGFSLGDFSLRAFLCTKWNEPLKRDVRPRPPFLRISQSRSGTLIQISRPLWAANLQCDAHFCLTEGFTVHVFSEMALCTKCARIDHFQSVGLSFEQKQIPRFVVNVS